MEVEQMALDWESVAQESADSEVVHAHHPHPYSIEEQKSQTLPKRHPIIKGSDEGEIKPPTFPVKTQSNQLATPKQIGITLSGPFLYVYVYRV